MTAQLRRERLPPWQWNQGLASGRSLSLSTLTVTLTDKPIYASCSAVMSAMSDP
jgi:hypothetical protein